MAAPSAKREDEVGDWRIQSPCRIELIGPSGTGKSSVLLKLATDDSVWINPPERLIYCSPEAEEDPVARDTAEKLRRATTKRLWCADGLPSLREMLDFSEGRHALLILDDMMVNKHLAGMNQLAAMHARHNQLSCLFAIQTPFAKAKAGFDPVAFSRNMTGRFVFYQRADWDMYRRMNTKMFPEKPGFLLWCLSKARGEHDNDQQGVPYVYVNLHPFATMPRRFSAMSKIFADERPARRWSSLAPEIYDMDAYRSQ